MKHRQMKMYHLKFYFNTCNVHLLLFLLQPTIHN